tara:strand:+ start:3829 stop:4038 length:210 start_codon:yes stop_codon:yes gene_type:complete
MEIIFKPNKLDAYNKIVEVIESCKIEEHLDGAKNMIYTFSKVFNNTQENKELIKDLETYLSIKTFLIIL